MTRPRKKKNEKKKVTGFSLTPGQISRVGRLSKEGKVSRSSFVGSFIDQIWEKKQGAKVTRKKTSKKKVKKSKAGGKKLKK